MRTVSDSGRLDAVISGLMGVQLAEPSCSFRNRSQVGLVESGMRFRLPEWDVAMPEPLVSYWMAWNEPDLSAIRGHLENAVDPEVDWNDPRDSFVGIDALDAAVHRLRTKKPEYRFVIASEVDHHHGRYRYRWDMTRRGRVLMEGLDVVTTGTESGLINRVDGFFGAVSPIAADRDLSGVPALLLRSGR